MKIYPQLRLIWAAFLVSALTLLLSASENKSVLLLSSLIGLAAHGVIAFALSRIAAESQRFNRAFLYQFVSLVLLALSTVCGLFSPEPEGMLGTFTSLLTLCGGLFALIAEYQLFWALDERVIPCGYAYPARRIRWCFYTPLLGALAGSLITVLLATRLFASVTTEAELATISLTPFLWVIIAAQLLSQLIVLALLFRYNRAVCAREQDPLAS